MKRPQFLPLDLDTLNTDLIAIKNMRNLGLIDSSLYFGVVSGGVLYVYSTPNTLVGSSTLETSGGSGGSPSNVITRATDGDVFVSSISPDNTGAPVLYQIYIWHAYSLAGAAWQLLTPLLSSISGSGNIISAYIIDIFKSGSAWFTIFSYERDAAYLGVRELALGSQEQHYATALSDVQAIYSGKINSDDNYAFVLVETGGTFKRVVYDVSGNSFSSSTFTTDPATPTSYDVEKQQYWFKIDESGNTYEIVMDQYTLSFLINDQITSYSTDGTSTIGIIWYELLMGTLDISHFMFDDSIWDWTQKGILKKIQYIEPRDYKKEYLTQTNSNLTGVVQFQDTNGNDALSAFTFTNCAGEVMLSLLGKLNPLKITASANSATTTYSLSATTSDQLWAALVYLPDATHQRDLEIIDSSNNVICEVQFQSDGNIDFIGSGVDDDTDIQAYSAGQWYLVEVNYQTNNTCTLSIDGTSISTVTGGNYTPETFRISIATSGDYLVIDAIGFEVDSFVEGSNKKISAYVGWGRQIGDAWFATGDTELGIFQLDYQDYKPSTVKDLSKHEMYKAPKIDLIRRVDAQENEWINLYHDGYQLDPPRLYFGGKVYKTEGERQLFFYTMKTWEDEFKRTKISLVASSYTWAAYLKEVIDTFSNYLWYGRGTNGHVLQFREEFLQDYKLDKKSVAIQGVVPFNSAWNEDYDYKLTDSGAKTGVVQTSGGLGDWTEGTNHTLSVETNNGHINSLKCVATASNSSNLPLTPQTSGFVEFFMDFDTANGAFVLLDSGFLTMCYVQMTSATNVRIYYAATFKDVTVTSGEQIHGRIEFDCSTNLQTVDINGTEEITAQAFYLSRNATSIGYIRLYTSSAATFYVDAIGYSWDSYVAGSNRWRYIDGFIDKNPYGSSISYVASQDGHIGVLKLENGAELVYNFSATQTSGDVEWFIQPSQTNCVFNTYIESGGSLLYTRLDAAGNIDLVGATSSLNVTTYSANTWNQFREELIKNDDCVIKLNGTTLDTITGNNVDLDNIRFLDVTGTGTFYIDAIGFSWDGFVAGSVKQFAYLTWADLCDTDCTATLITEKAFVNDIFEYVLELYDNNASGIAKIIIHTFSSCNIFSFWCGNDDVTKGLNIQFYELTTRIGFINIDSSLIQWYDGSFNSLNAAVNNTMYHVCLVFSATDDDVDIYINGVFDSTQSLENNITTEISQCIIQTNSADSGYYCYIADFYAGIQLSAAMNTYNSISPLLTTTQNFNPQNTHFPELFETLAEETTFVVSVRPSGQVYVDEFSPSGLTIDVDSEKKLTYTTKPNKQTEKFSYIIFYGGYLNGKQIWADGYGEPNFGNYDAWFPTIDGRDPSDIYFDADGNPKSYRLDAMVAAALAARNISFISQTIGYNQVGLIYHGQWFIFSWDRYKYDTERWYFWKSVLYNALLDDSRPDIINVFWTPTDDDKPFEDRVESKVNKLDQAVGSVEKKTSWTPYDPDETTPDFDETDFTNVATWQDFDISAIVGVNKKRVMIHAEGTDNVTGSNIYIREKGLTNDPPPMVHSAVANIVSHDTRAFNTDKDGLLEIKIDPSPTNWSSIEIFILEGRDS